MGEEAYVELITARSNAYEAIEKLNIACNKCDMDFDTELENIIFDIRGGD